MYGVRAEGAKFGQADLENANLTAAELRCADMSQTYLVGADFTDADIESANFTEAIVEPHHAAIIEAAAKRMVASLEVVFPRTENPGYGRRR